MRPGHFRERPLGLRYYASATAGIGGRLRVEPADFRVREQPGVDLEPVDADRGDYPHLVVRATCDERDTHRLAADIATTAGIHPDAVAWSGTKDAQARTTQYLSVRGLAPADLPAVDGVTLETVGRFGRHLEFGDHAGNDFDVTVREGTDEGHIVAIRDELATDDDTDEVAMPHLFGHQRFGVRRPVTHRVGRAMLAGAYREAVVVYLTVASAHEPPPTVDARERLEGALGDPAALEAAADAIPGYLSYERTIARALATALREGDDDPHRRALAALPWALRRLFVNAVQSHAFNEIVSERRRRGLPLDEPVVGDVICMVDDGDVPDADRPQRVSAGRLEAARRHCRRGRAVVTAPIVGTATEPADGRPGTIERAVMDRLSVWPEAFAGDDRLVDLEGTRRPVALSTTLAVEGDPPTFTFSLPPGGYATVVLREFMKTDPLRMIAL